MGTQTLLPSSALQGWQNNMFDQNQSGLRDLQSDHEHQKSEHTRWNFNGAASDGQQPLPKSGIERLPFEVLDQILSYLLLDVPPESYTPRNADLMACLLTCRTLYLATFNTLYKHITIPHSRIFSMMLNNVSNHPELGQHVRRLDFSHYTPIGLGRTRKDSRETKNVVPETLVQCLRLMPNIREFLVQEHIDDELSEEILQRLFCMNFLQAIDFCACSSPIFVRNFSTTMANHLPPSLPNLKRISLHECSTLQCHDFEPLFSRLPNLTHLDVSRTLITSRILYLIPSSARLTHLSLSRCTQLSGPDVVQFLITHPSTRNLQYLNLMSDPTRHRLLSSTDLTTLLPSLPLALRSLNLNGSNLTSDHLPLLLPLTKYLEELSISHSTLSIHDLNSIFRPPITPYVSADPDTPLPANWTPPSLHYLDLTSNPNLNSRSILFAPSTLLLTPHSHPLEVIELSDENLMSAPFIKRYSHPHNGLGWTVKELGRRIWFVRDEEEVDENLNDNNNDDDDDETDLDLDLRGSRPWKMGARWWGMRKIPVAVADVGGIYGYFMFKC